METILSFYVKSIHSSTSMASSYTFFQSVGMCKGERTRSPYSFKASNNSIILQMLLVYPNASVMIRTTSSKQTSSVGTTHLSESRAHFRASKNSVLNIWQSIIICEGNFSPNSRSWFNTSDNSILPLSEQFRTVMLALVRSDSA